MTWLMVLQLRANIRIYITCCIVYAAHHCDLVITLVDILLVHANLIGPEPSLSLLDVRLENLKEISEIAGDPQRMVIDCHSLCIIVGAPYL